MVIFRLSTDSTRSESAVIPATPETKKKKTLMGKLKQLTKSRSIEDSGMASLLVTAGMQVNSDPISLLSLGRSVRTVLTEFQ